MELKSRQTQLLKSLSNSVGRGLSLADAMAEFDVSRRTVYYDISAINKWLALSELGSISVDGQYIKTCNVQWDKLDKINGASSRCNLTVEERQSLIFLHVALSCEPVTIALLTSIFEVSRNTILADIHRLREELSSLDLCLPGVSGIGYRVSGDEIAVRKHIWSRMQFLANSNRIREVRRFLQSTLVEATGNDIDYFELCRSLIKQYESDLRTRCFLESNGLEGMMVQVSWIRGLAGHSVAMGREEQITLMGTVSYRSVQCSAEKLKVVGITLPSEEIFYITSVLLGIKTANFSHQSEEDAYVSGLAENLILNFERVGCLTFVNKEFVHEQLSHHIRPLYYRLKYGIPVHNPLTDDVRKMYPMSFEFCRRAARESGLSDLSDDELAYLTIYLSSDLDNNMLEQGDTSATRILIVGASDMSTATLLKEQLLQACGINFEYEYVDPEKARRWTFESYALVLSLVHMPTEMHSENMVEVTPFLTEENKQHIYGILKGNRIIRRYNSLIDEIVTVIANNAPSSDFGWLFSDRIHFELFRLFDQDENCTVSPLTARPSDAHIRNKKLVLPHETSWEQAVLGCADALQDGIQESTLTERMANIIHSARFMYYRMAPDVVVVRCPVQGDKNARVEAQVALSSNGIVFPDGKPARLIVCVATINRYSHWGTLYSIYQMFSDQAAVDAFLAEAV